MTKNRLKIFRNTLNIKLRRWRSLLTILLIIFIILIIIYPFTNNFFKIKQINIISHGIDVSVNQNKLTQNWLFFDSRQLKSDLISNYPQIYDINIKKVFPDKLEISLISRQAIAIVKTNRGEIWVDENGIVLSHTPEFSGNLPRLIFNIDDVPDGSQIDNSKVLSCLKLIKYLNNNLDLGEFSNYENRYFQAKIDKTSILFTQESDMQITAATLQTLINRFRIKGNMPTLIDLRFEKPIIIN